MNRRNVLLLTMLSAFTAGAGDFHVDAKRGDDANDGLTEATAWRTVPRAQKQRLAAGDRLLLRAGCVWRLEKPFSVRVRGTRESPAVVTRYGEGPAPELRTSLDGLAFDWRRETNGVWSAAYGGPDVGNIVWGDACGFKKARHSDVKDDGDFFHDKAAGRIFLKWPQDPRTAFSQMEICRRTDVVSAVGARHAVIDGLAIMYTGSHGLRGDDIEGLTVRNCTFGWIGGSFLNEPGVKKNRPDGVRYGNGIEIWAKGACRDMRIEGCTFHDVYDTAMTNQGDGVGELDGMSIVSNRTLRCEQSYEFWFSNPGYKVGTISLRGNDFEGAGFGWSHIQRFNKNATHILSYAVKCPKGRILVEGNRFGATKQRAIWLFGDTAKDWLEFGENDWSDGGDFWWRERGAWGKSELKAGSNL